MEIQLSEIEIPYKLSDKMLEAIDEAEEQIKKGEFLTHEQAKQEVEEWLGE